MQSYTMPCGALPDFVGILGGYMESDITEK